MNNPYKIIYKVKNNNNEYQHNIYIFLGQYVDDKTKTILNEIKDLNLHDTLLKININDYKHLENKYHSKWYYYFLMINILKKL